MATRSGKRKGERAAAPARDTYSITLDVAINRADGSVDQRRVTLDNPKKAAAALKEMTASWKGAE